MSAELPLITEDDARRRAYAAFMESLGLSTPAARARVFRKRGLVIRGENELLYRSRERNGELVQLISRTTER